MEPALLPSSVMVMIEAPFAFLNSILSLTADGDLTFPDSSPFFNDLFSLLSFVSEM